MNCRQFLESAGRMGRVRGQLRSADVIFIERC